MDTSVKLCRRKLPQRPVTGRAHTPQGRRPTVSGVRTPSRRHGALPRFRFCKENQARRLAGQPLLSFEVYRAQTTGQQSRPHPKLHLTRLRTRRRRTCPVSPDPSAGARDSRNWTLRPNRLRLQWHYLRSCRQRSFGGQADPRDNRRSSGNGRFLAGSHEIQSGNTGIRACPTVYR